MALPSENVLSGALAGLAVLMTRDQSSLDRRLMLLLLLILRRDGLAIPHIIVKRLLAI